MTDQKVFIVNNDSNGVTVLRIFSDKNENETLTKMLFELSRTTDLEGKFDAQVHTRSILASKQLTGHREIAILGNCLDSDLPDESFRNAWIWDKSIRVDMDRARVIHMDAIRKVRNQELAALDVPFTKALESGDSKEIARITKLKQTLRDIPQTFDIKSGIDTTEKLKASWPEILMPS